MKTDFKALVENAKLEFDKNSNEIEELDVLTKLENANGTFSLLDENGLDTMDVQILEMALVESVMLELFGFGKKKEEESNVTPAAPSASDEPEGKMAKTKAFFKRIWDAVVRFTKMCWDMVFNRNKECLDILIKALDTFEEETRKDKFVEDEVKGTRAEYRKALVSVVGEAKKWFREMAPKYKKLVDDAESIKGDEDKSGGQNAKRALTKVSDLKSKTNTVVKGFDAIAKSVKKAVRNNKSHDAMVSSMRIMHDEGVEMEKAKSQLQLSFKTARAAIDAIKSGRVPSDIKE